MPQSFLGNGWDFLKLIGQPAEGEETGVALVAEDESVRQSVWIVLGTAPGERIMRPDFGCGIHDRVFSVADSTTLGRVARDVRDALVRWEPRIEVQDVQASVDPAVTGRLLISVEYRVRTTNNQFNLVYPFYLERSAT
ncbi:MAG: putative phage baseplate outer wedge protein (acidic lysozyme) [Gemmatimonadetes bacterium]|nr:putative phage baseplate outer wedge protein (acidic lysozyme) [Gemmatimonadota bacterium]